MRRRVSVAAVLLFCIILLATKVSAASANATLSGPETVCAGDTITLTFEMGGTDLRGVTGTFSYDVDQLSLTNVTANAAIDWTVEFEGNRFIAYDHNFCAPINENTAVFTATFLVNADIAEGTTVDVSCIDLVASDGQIDIHVADSVYSANAVEAVKNATGGVWIGAAVGVAMIAILVAGVLFLVKKK